MRNADLPRQPRRLRKLALGQAFGAGGDGEHAAGQGFSGDGKHQRAVDAAGKSDENALKRLDVVFKLQVFFCKGHRSWVCCIRP